MSSKKKQPKDKLASGDATLASPTKRPTQNWLLADQAVIRGSNVSPLFNNVRHCTSGIPFGDVTPNVWLSSQEAWLAGKSREEHTATRKEMGDAWMHSVASKLPSPVLYPHHTVAAEVRPNTAGMRRVDLVVSTILRILAVHTRGTNVQTSSATVFDPCSDVERLVGWSVYSTGGYHGPEAETKDSTFHAGYSSVSAHGRNLRFVTHSDATHIAVCCGSYFYRLAVMDREAGAVLSPARLAEALEAIVAHAEAKDAAFDALAISDEDREELKSVRSLFARLSSVHDDISADVDRRLREVSVVNQYSLDQLEGALFTLVLGTSTDSCAVLPDQAQWMRSCLSVYCPSLPGDGHGSANSSGTPLLFRVSAFAASLEAAQRFIIRLFEDDTVLDALPEAAPLSPIDRPIRVEPIPAVAEVTSEKPPATPRNTPQPTRVSSGRRSTNQHATIAKEEAVVLADNSLNEAGANGGDPLGKGNAGRTLAPADRTALVTDDGAVANLDLWLPRGHRSHLLPVAPSSYTPAWVPVALPFALPLADACLALILGLEATKRESSSDGHDGSIPRLVVALLLPGCTAPVTQLLYSGEVARFIEAHRSSSALVTRDVPRLTRQAARSSVAALLNECADNAATVDPAGPADIVLTLAVTHRSNTAGFASTTAFGVRLNESFTDVGLPAVVQARGNAVQVRAEKSLSLSECVLSSNAISVGATYPEDDPVVGLLAENTAAELAHF